MYHFLEEIIFQLLCTVFTLYIQMLHGNNRMFIDLLGVQFD